MGMTLIEIMVVLVIMGIIASFAVPSWRGQMSQKNLDGMAKVFEQSIRLARAEAIQRNVEVRIRPIAAGSDWSNGWRIEFTNAANANEIIRQFEPQSSNLVLSSATFNSSSPMTFSPSGAVNTTGFLNMLYSNCADSKKMFIYNMLASGIMQRTVSVNTGC